MSLRSKIQDVVQTMYDSGDDMGLGLGRAYKGRKSQAT